MIPYGDGRNLHVPHEAGVMVSGIEDEPFAYPAPHYCANDYACAACEKLGHPQRLNALHSVDGEVCHACQSRDLQRKMNKIQVVGELFPHRAYKQRGILSL